MEVLRAFFPCLFEHPLMFIITISFIWVTLFGIYMFISSIATFIIVPLKEKRSKNSDYFSNNW